MAKGTCGESATRKRSASANRSASRSSSSSTRKRSRASNNGSVTLRNATQTRSAGVSKGYLRGITAFKRYAQGNTVANMNTAMALKASRIGDKLAKRVLSGEKLTPAQQKALKLYLNAVS